MCAGQADGRLGSLRGGNPVRICDKPFGKEVSVTQIGLCANRFREDPAIGAESGNGRS